MTSSAISNLIIGTVVNKGLGAAVDGVSKVIPGVKSSKDKEDNKIKQTGDYITTIGKIFYIAAGVFAAISVIPIFGRLSIVEVALCTMTGKELTAVGNAIKESPQDAKKLWKSIKILKFDKDSSEKIFKNTWALKHIYSFMTNTEKKSLSKKRFKLF